MVGRLGRKEITKKSLKTGCLQNIEMKRSKYEEEKKFILKLMCNKLNVTNCKLNKIWRNKFQEQSSP